MISQFIPIRHQLRNPRIRLLCRASAFLSKAALTPSTKAKVTSPPSASLSVRILTILVRCSYHQSRHPLILHIRVQLMLRLLPLPSNHFCMPLQQLLQLILPLPPMFFSTCWSRSFHGGTPYFSVASRILYLTLWWFAYFSDWSYCLYSFRRSVEYEDCLCNCLAVSTGLSMIFAHEVELLPEAENWHPIRPERIIRSTWRLDYKTTFLRCDNAGENTKQLAEVCGNKVSRLSILPLIRLNSTALWNARLSPYINTPWLWCSWLRLRMNTRDACGLKPWIPQRYSRTKQLIESTRTVLMTYYGTIFPKLCRPYKVLKEFGWIGHVSTRTKLKKLDKKTIKFLGHSTDHASGTYRMCNP